jgi:hypothetical protein
MAIKIDYDFIKSEEAKQIYIKLERERMLKEKYEDDEDDLDSIFTFEDEEKKKMVERFVFEARVPYQGFETVEKIEKGRLEVNLRHAKDLINSTMDLKMEIDPDYIYDTWLVESRKLKQKCWFLEWNVEDPVKFLMGNED